MIKLEGYLSVVGPHNRKWHNIPNIQSTISHAHQVGPIRHKSNTPKKELVNVGLTWYVFDYVLDFFSSGPSTESATKGKCGSFPKGDSVIVCNSKNGSILRKASSIRGQISVTCDRSTFPELPLFILWLVSMHVTKYIRACTFDSPSLSQNLKLASVPKVTTKSFVGCCTIALTFPFPWGDASWVFNVRLLLILTNRKGIWKSKHVLLCNGIIVPKLQCFFICYTYNLFNIRKRRRMNERLRTVTM